MLWACHSENAAQCVSEYESCCGRVIMRRVRQAGEQQQYIMKPFMGMLDDYRHFFLNMFSVLVQFTKKQLNK